MARMETEARRSRAGLPPVSGRSTAKRSPLAGSRAQAGLALPIRPTVLRPAAIWTGVAPFVLDAGPKPAGFELGLTAWNQERAWATPAVSPDGRQARLDYGGRQQPVDRVGHCPKPARPRALKSRSLSRVTPSKKRVEPLAAELGSGMVLPCDVTDTASMERCSKRSGQVGQAGRHGPRRRVCRPAELDGRYVDTSEELHPRAY